MSVTGQSPDAPVRDAVRRLALPLGELCFVASSVVLVPILAYLLALGDDPDVRGESWGWTMLFGGSYAVLGLVLGVPILALSLRGWLSRLAVTWPPPRFAALLATIAALAAAPLPLVLLLVGAEDASVAARLAATAVFAAPSVVAAALAGLLARWAASDQARARRLTIAGGAAVGIFLAAALVLQLLPLFVRG